MKLTEFKMPTLNSCSICGVLIQQNQPVFALDMNAVTAGNGVCAKHKNDEFDEFGKPLAKGKKGGAGESVETADQLQPQAGDKSKGKNN